MNRLYRTLTAFFAVALFSSVGFAQEAVEASAVLTDDPNGGSLSSAVEIAVLLTVLSLLPAILVTVTSFTRIVIVLSFVRRALGVNELPPNPVIIGLALYAHNKRQSGGSRLNLYEPVELKIVWCQT